MSAADDQLREANWTRMRTAIERAATEYRRVAADLESISFDDSRGRRRSPDAIISQAALTADLGRVHADLIHRLATWAESINEIDQHGAASSRVLCPYMTDDAECVLTSEHTGPTRDGIVQHLTADGTMFR